MSVRGVSLRTVRWGGTLLPQAIGRAMEWPVSCPKRKLPGAIYNNFIATASLVRSCAVLAVSGSSIV